MLVWVFLAISLATALIFLVQRGGANKLPFAFAVVCGGWAGPQLVAQSADVTAPVDGLAIVALMATLSIVATIVGWSLGRSRARMAAAEFDFDRLVVACALLTAFGLLMKVFIGAMPDDIRAQSQWTGPITILAFFSQVSRVALAFSAVLALHRRTPATVVLFALNVISVLPAVLIYGRRSEIVTVAVVAALSLWFVRRRAIPRLVILVAIPLGTLLVHSIGEIRSISYGVDEYGRVVTKSRSLSDISAIDFVGNLPIFNPSRALEVRNAAVEMWAVSTTDSYSYGASFWNSMISQYVPGQFIGFENKKALYIGTSIAALVLDTTQYTSSTGTTSTGFSDSFRMFWLFGALIFFVNAFIMRRFYDSGMAGDAKGQILYMALMLNALQCVTHESVQFLTILPFYWAVTSATFWLTGGLPKRTRKSAAGTRQNVPFGPHARPIIGRRI